MAELRLRPMTLSDLEWSYQLSAAEHALATYRFRGWTPNPETIGQLIFDNAHVHLIATVDDERLGMLTSYRYDPRSQHTRIAMAFTVAQSDFIVPFTVRFLSYLYETFPIRCVYFEGPASRLKRLTQVPFSSFVEVQGRLTNSEWFDGQWQDLLIVYLSRVSFSTLVSSSEIDQKWLRIPVGFSPEQVAQAVNFSRHG